MSIEINLLPQEYRRYLTKAEYDSEDSINGKIDTGKELLKAFELLPNDLAKQLAENIAAEIDSLGGIEKRMLRKADYHDGKGGYNGKIDSVAEFIEILHALSPSQADKLTQLVKYKKTDYSSTMSLKAASAKGRYHETLQNLVNFLIRNDGDPPNASKTFKVQGGRARGFYHLYQDEASHIKNGGATTSETQALCYNMMALFGKLNGKNGFAKEADNYLGYFMMPHDGRESRNLPDQKLKNSTYAPSGLVHWLVDISGKAKSGTGIFGENTTYNMYDPTSSPPKEPYACLPQNKHQPDLSAYLKGSNNSYKFSSALDADQWRVAGLAVSGSVDDIEKAKSSLEGALSKNGKYAGVMMFGRYWGANLKDGWGWKADGDDLYAGYQDPAVWFIMKKTDIAKKIVAFLEDAQNSYPKKSGLFMPVWNKGRFRWDGADPNTNWMGFQYRTFAHLAHYYYLSGDKKAKNILDKFYSFIKDNLQIDSTGKVQIPYLLDKQTGSIGKKSFSPDMHGLLAQGLIYMAKKAGEAKYRADAELILNDLSNNRQIKSGRLLGSFPDPSAAPETPANLIYGFHQCEVGIALALYELLLN